MTGRLACRYKAQCDANLARERERLANDAHATETRRAAEAGAAKKEAQERLAEMQRRFEEERRATAVRLYSRLSV